MELKLSKVYVPNEDFEQSLIDEAISDVITICSLNDNKTAKSLLNSQFLIIENLDYKEQELYTFTKEELERVIGDALVYGKDFTKNIGRFQSHTQLSFEEHKKNYINSILK